MKREIRWETDIEDMCAVKKKYASPQLAYRALRRINKNGGITDHVNVYKCGRCNMYHIGRNSRLGEGK